MLAGNSKSLQFSAATSVVARTATFSYSATGFESKMPVFFLYFVNYRSWLAEILQERAEGCIQDVFKYTSKTEKTKGFLFCGFVGVVFGHKFKIIFRHFI